MAQLRARPPRCGGCPTLARMAAPDAAPPAASGLLLHHFSPLAPLHTLYPLRCLLLLPATLACCKCLPFRAHACVKLHGAGAAAA